jgi:hypothetical protein
MNDGTDDLPEPVGRRALAAAEDAIDWSLRGDGYHLDLFARLEVIDLALDDAVTMFSAVDGPAPVH